MSFYGGGTVQGALRLNGRTTPGVSAAGEGRIYFDSGLNVFRVSQNGGAFVDLLSTNPALATVLAAGNTTGGSDIVVSDGDDLVMGAGSGNANLLWAAGSGGDIGSSDQTQSPDVIYAATNVVVGNTVTIGTASVAGSGALAVDAAAGLSVGATNATSVTIGRTGVTTTVPGALAVTQGTTFTGAADFDGGITIGAGQSIAGDGALTIDAAGVINIGDTDATAINIGRLGLAVSITDDLTVQGDLTVNGTTTTINSTSLAVTDRFILCANGSSNLSGGLAVSQANGAGNDLIFMWNDAAGRAEVGFGDSSTNPAAVSSFADAKVSNLLLGGTAVTADAGLTVTATAATLSLVATGANAVSFTSHSATIALNTAGDPSLDTTAQDIVGAINEAFAAAGDAHTLADTLAAGNVTGGTDIVVSTADAIVGQTTLDLEGGTSGVNGSNVTLTGGVATTGVGGGIVATGGAGGTTGAGGAITLLSGAGGSTSGNSGAVTIRSGAVTSGTAGVVELGVGGASQWRVSATGMFVAVTDDTNDIGATGANRPRRVYVGTEVVVGNTVTIGTATVRGSTNLTVEALSGNLGIDATGESSIDGDVAVNVGAAGTPIIQIGNQGTAGQQMFIDAEDTISMDVVSGSISIGASGAPALTLGNASCSVNFTGSTMTFDAASTFSIGGTTATAITLGRTGITATVPGGLAVTQTSAFTGAATFTAAADFDGGLTVAAGQAVTGDGALTVTSGGGAALALNSASGTVTTNATALTAAAGLAIDGTGAVSLGGTNATSVSVGRTGVTTTVPGALAVTQTSAFTGAATFTAAADFDGGLTVAAGQAVTGDGALSVTATAAALTLAATGSNAVQVATNGSNRISVLGTGEVGVNVTPVSTLDVDGSISHGDVATVSGNTTLDGTHSVVLVDASGGAVTITLPAAAGVTRRFYTIKKIDSSANAVTIDANGAETIDGAATQSLAVQYDTLGLVCNGTAWFLV